MAKYIDWQQLDPLTTEKFSGRWMSGAQNTGEILLMAGQSIFPSTNIGLLSSGTKASRLNPATSKSNGEANSDIRQPRGGYTTNSI